MAEQHLYTVNLNPAKRVPRRKRAGRAINLLKEYVQQHSKVDEVHIANAVNEYVWQGSAANPPRAVNIKVVERDGVAHVQLADEEFALPTPDEEETVATGELSDEDIAESNVDEVKDLVRDGTVAAQRALDIEYAGKNRKTLIGWLENRIEAADETAEEPGAPAEPDEAAEPDTDDVDGEPEEEPPAEEDDEATYDLPEEALDVLRDGTIADGKDAAKELNKAEFEKLLNFEEAHQNRKGMKQFLRSNMN